MLLRSYYKVKILRPVLQARPCQSISIRMGQESPSSYNHSAVNPFGYYDLGEDKPWEIRLCPSLKC